MLEDDLLLAVGLIPGVDLIVNEELSRGDLEQDSARFASRADCEHFRV